MFGGLPVFLGHTRFVSIDAGPSSCGIYSVNIMLVAMDAGPGYVGILVSRVIALMLGRS